MGSSALLDGSGTRAVVCATEVVHLTPRERQVLTLAAYSNWEIAQMSGVREQAVKNVWTAVYRKLGVRGNGPRRIRALLAALRCGMLSLSEVPLGNRRTVVD